MSAGHDTVVFVDHSFHQTSKSSDFFLLALSEAANVVRYWDSAWKGGTAASYEEMRHEQAGLAVFWQAYPTLSFLRRFKGPVVVVPMFDDAASEYQMRVMAAYRVSAICFSEAVERIYRRAGMEVFPLRYAPAPTEDDAPDGPLNVFFWERGQVSWPDVKAMIGEQRIGKIFLKQTPDPGYASSIVPDEDRERYDLEIITDWIDKEAYEDILRRCHLYIAPRFTEGIGMSFLEAMASGRAVAGFDQPTMNEYIADREDGYLFKLPIERPIDFGEAREIGARARGKIVRMKEAYDPRLAEVVESILQLPHRAPDRTALALVEADRFARRCGNRLKRSLRLARRGA